MIRSRSVYLMAVCLLGAACAGDPSGPVLGRLAVTVSGLPAGVAPALTVTGPGGYAHDLAASATLSDLTPGSYTVTAASVSSGGAEFDPSPGEQTVQVSEGDTPANVSVAYQMVAGTLVVTVAGLPSGTAAGVQVTGPNAYG